MRRILLFWRAVGFTSMTITPLIKSYYTNSKIFKVKLLNLLNDFQNIFEFKTSTYKRLQKAGIPSYAFGTKALQWLVSTNSHKIDEYRMNMIAIWYGRPSWWLNNNLWLESLLCLVESWPNMIRYTIWYLISLLTLMNWPSQLQKIRTATP